MRYFILMFTYLLLINIHTQFMAAAHSSKKTEKEQKTSQPQAITTIAAEKKITRTIFRILYRIDALQEQAYKSCLKLSLPIPTIDQNNNTLLHQAVLSRIYPLVKQLATDPKLLNAQNGLKQTPLFLSCRYGFYELTDLLIAAKANLHILDFHQRTPLHIACARGHARCAQTLIVHDADVTKVDEWGNTALHDCAMHRNNPVLIELLLSKKAALDARNLKKETPLYVAVKSMKAENIRTLLAHGANILAQNDHNLAPIDLTDIFMQTIADKHEREQTCDSIRGYRDCLLGQHRTYTQDAYSHTYKQGHACIPGSYKSPYKDRVYTLEYMCNLVIAKNRHVQQKLDKYMPATIKDRHYSTLTWAPRAQAILTYYKNGTTKKPTHLLPTLSSLTAHHD